MKAVEISEFSNSKLFEGVKSLHGRDLIRLVLSDKPPGARFIFRNGFSAYVSLSNLASQILLLLQDSYPEFFL